jgi:hypothetical protein
VRLGRQISKRDKQLGSPSSDWRRWIDWGCCRRVAAADRWWRGRGHPNSGEDRGGTGQRAARAASLGPRGCAETVGWLGNHARSRTRRWLPGGGRRDTGSGEPAARAGQQTSARATGGPSGVRRSTRLQRKAGGDGVHREGSYGGRRRLGARAGRRPAGFIAQLEAVECCLAHQGERRGSTSTAWSGYGGMAGDAQRPIANRGRRCARTAATPLGGRRSGREHMAHRERVGMAVRRGRPNSARTGGC